MPEEILSRLLLTDADLVFVTPEMKAKTAKEVQHYLEVLPSFERTYLIVTASHRESNRNFISKISCKKGIPIGGYAYDAQNDTYHIQCNDYLHLGYIPISFIMKVKGINYWEIRVPLPENVIKKYLNSLQKKELRNFKTHFKDCDITYIQMIDPN